jgi:hypothetical protein
MTTIITMRLFQIVAFALSYEEIKEPIQGVLINPTTQLMEISINNLYWHRLPTLIKLSTLQFGVYAFLLFWTVQGTFFFIQSEKDNAHQ